MYGFPILPAKAWKYNSNLLQHMKNVVVLQQSPVTGADFKRYSGAFNGTLKASDKLTFMQA